MINNKIKIYLSARVSKDAQNWNDLVSNSLKRPISVFMPQKHTPRGDKHETFPVEIYQLCVNAIKESDMCLALPPYGRDCAWEIGWYANSDKPLIIFVEKEIEWLRDWMIKGGADYIVTNNLQTYEILKEDIILKNKSVIFIEDIEQLGPVLIKIYNKHYKN